MPKAARPSAAEDVVGAIDVGTNAVRLELARVLPDGSLETLHTERDPIRPGEGLYLTGAMAKPVVDRLVSTLRRYQALASRYQARLRAVATSALREAKNRDEVVRRVRREAGVGLEVVSGREEARLICLGVLHGARPAQRSLCIDIGGGSTEVIVALGETPKELISVDLGAVRVSELFRSKDFVSKKQLGLMRRFVQETLAEAIPSPLKGAPKGALGSSGTISAIVGYAHREGVAHATADDITDAVDTLAAMTSERRRRRFDSRRADIIVAGAVVLEGAVRHLGVSTVAAVDRGLREGVLLDLLRRRKVDAHDHSLADTALAYGLRLGFGEAHARQVAKLSLEIFDELAAVHQLPAAVRPLLEVAALLHDIGHVVSHQRHHKHSQYLIEHADLPGLSEHERLLVSLIARFHRRSTPELHHEVFQRVSPTEARVVRKCATLLRMADSLDRSHRQPVRAVSFAQVGRAIVVKIRSRQPIDLELWDLEHEVELFRAVFSKRLVVQS
jgi:exopolyphosphatase/guanosine-5'-triphosphate,3'-diphosphate pyrophosphatase